MKGTGSAGIETCAASAVRTTPAETRATSETLEREITVSMKVTFLVCAMLTLWPFMPEGCLNCRVVHEAKSGFHSNQPPIGVPS